jgi:hypothetical protein
MMEKSSAAQVIKALLQLDAHLNAVDAELRELPDDAERKSLLRALGAIILNLDSELIRPLVRQYPDLDPDR